MPTTIGGIPYYRYGVGIVYTPGSAGVLVPDDGTSVTVRDSSGATVTVRDPTTQAVVGLVSRANGYYPPFLAPATRVTLSAGVHTVDAVSLEAADALLDVPTAISQAQAAANAAAQAAVTAQTATDRANNVEQSLANKEDLGAAASAISTHVAAFGHENIAVSALQLTRALQVHPQNANGTWSEPGVDIDRNKPLVWLLWSGATPPPQAPGTSWGFKRASAYPFDILAATIAFTGQP